MASTIETVSCAFRLLCVAYRLPYVMNIKDVYIYSVPIADNFEYFYLKALDEERRSNHVVHMQLQKTTAELNEYKNLCEQFEFKKQNYDRIKS